MVERGECARLPLEAGEALGIRRERRRQHLDRDVAVEPAIPRSIHLAHRAGTERSDDAVGTDDVTWLHGMVERASIRCSLSAMRRPPLALHLQLRARAWTRQHQGLRVE